MGTFANRSSTTRAVAEGALPTTVSKHQFHDQIRDSWQRCEETGLNPATMPKQVDVTPQRLRELVDKDSELLYLVRSELKQLQKQLPHENCLLSFANRDAVLMEVICSNPATHAAAKAVPGTCWDEQFRGTNAMGTAAFLRGPVVVDFHEHYLRWYGSVNCVATAINDPEGEMIGVLNVSSHRPLRPQHTMSLLCMSSLHIESELFRNRYRSQIVLQFHSREEFARTTNAGLIALNEEGRILASNRHAREILDELPVEAGRHFEEIFRVPFGKLIDQQRTTGLTQLADIKGSCSSVHVHMPRTKERCSSVSSQSSSSRMQTSEAVGFACNDPAVAHAVSLVTRAVAISIPILIRGETGTGKEMLAQYAHRVSGRGGRFIAVNCAAIPESLLEAELFGYCGGAFTGARSGGSEGLVIQANGGTLFLDEIGDMPLTLQPSLLRFLDSWTVRAIGSTRETKVDIQLITATNNDLELAVAAGRFRRDLVHRINGLEAFLPPLRERSDFEEIVVHLLSQTSPRLRITEEAVSLLREQPWSGNVRELRNLLIRSALVCTGPELTVNAIELLLCSRSKPTTTVHRQAASLVETRRKAILDAYRSNGENISKAAQCLNVSRNLLYRELRRAGLIEANPKGRSSRNYRRAL